MRYGRSVLLAVAAILVAGCAANVTTTSTSAPRAGEAARAVSFELLSESMLSAGRVGIMTGTADDGGMMIELRGTGVRGLKALYGRLRYDPAVWAPGTLTPAACWGSGDSVLSLAVEREPGMLDIGIVMTRWDRRAGLSSDGVLGEVKLRPATATRGNQRAASAFDPVQVPSYLAMTGLDRHTREVSLAPKVPGDYDQNGEVNIADLTPLANHLGETGGWDLTTIQSVLDGDGNGEINLADITPIGMHFGQSFTWNIYYGQVTVATPDAGLLAHVDYSTRQGNPAAERVRLVTTLAAIEPGPFYYAAPVIDGVLASGGDIVVESGPHPVRFYISNPCYSLEWDSVGGELKYQHILQCDGDLSGAVNIADLTPIGAHFGASGPFPHDSLEWYADLDKNGEINIADVTPLGPCQGATLDGYLFYTTTDTGQLPPAYSFPATAPAAQVSFLPSGESWGSLAFPSGAYVWLRPYVGDPTDIINVGAPSEVIQIP